MPMANQQSQQLTIILALEKALLLWNTRILNYPKAIKLMKEKSCVEESSGT